MARKSEQELVQFLLGNTNGMFRKFPPATFDVILFAVNGYFMVCVRQHSAKIRGWNRRFLRKNDKRDGRVRILLRGGCMFLDIAYTTKRLTSIEINLSHIFAILRFFFTYLLPPLGAKFLGLSSRGFATFTLIVRPSN